MAYAAVVLAEGGGVGVLLRGGRVLDERVGRLGPFVHVVDVAAQEHGLEAALDLEEGRVRRLEPEDGGDLVGVAVALVPERDLPVHAALLERLLVPVVQEVLDAVVAYERSGRAKKDQRWKAPQS